MPDILRFLLVASAVGMIILAGLYLCRRKMSLTEYIGWGLLALFVPFAGPFLVILLGPGESTGKAGK
jgi:hypothetical protein